jgi:hypothetical protein
MNITNPDNKFFIAWCVALLCVSVIVISHQINQTITEIENSKLMAKNIEVAIDKGINPLAVRCSYAKSDDNICVVFATQSSNFVLPSMKQ